MERREIHGKAAYIFESHNAALAAWAEIKAKHEEELLLLTIDHHKDKHEAFIGWAYKINGGMMDNVEPIMAERISKVDWRDEGSIRDAVNDLRNDEQIDAALHIGLFSFAFCFNNQHGVTEAHHREDRERRRRAATTRTQ